MVLPRLGPSSSWTQSSSRAQSRGEAAPAERVEDQLDYVFHSGISKQPTNSKFFLMLSMPGGIIFF